MIGTRGFGSLAAAGRIVAPKVTLTRINTNSYVINNYDSRFTYTVSGPSGASFSGNILNLPTLFFPGPGPACNNRGGSCPPYTPVWQTFTVIASTPKGASLSNLTTVIERRTPSFSWVVVGSDRDFRGWDPVFCAEADESKEYWEWILQPYECGRAPIFGPFFNVFGWVKQSPPSGFIETGSEWYRIT